MNREERIEENRYCLFLQMIPGIGKITIKNLLENMGCPSGIYKAGEKELQVYLNASQTEKFLRMREKESPLEIENRLLQSGIQYVSVFHPDYPKRLEKIEDKPIGLFVKGTLPKESGLTVSVIGTRSNSSYGRKMTEEYVRILSAYQVDVVSGMARGIDGIAQKNVLKNRGRTYAVLGSGVDICYPPEHIDLYSQLVSCGGVISEYRPGTQPVAGLFPPRNRIISGLSDIVMVMEARQKSGTMITVDMALEQGKEIYALPGRITDPLSAGCNALIGQGAGILPPLHEFEKIIAEMAKTKKNEKGNYYIEEKEAELQKSEGEDSLKKWLWNSLSEEPKSIAQLWTEWEKQNDKDNEKEVFPESEILMILTEFGMKNRMKMNVFGKWELI